ncbi:hypothetical protein Hanom_Chr15g01381941 [Helianthus anomalus]
MPWLDLLHLGLHHKKEDVDEVVVEDEIEEKKDEKENVGSWGCSRCDGLGRCGWSCERCWLWNRKVIRKRSKVQGR